MDEEREKIKIHKHPVTLATVGSVVMICCGIAPLFVILGRGVIVTYFADSLAEPIKVLVAKETASTKNGVQALLQDKIDELAARVTVLRVRQAREPQKFTDADAAELASAEARLAKQQRALRVSEAETVASK